jgi:hypothetical protein
MSESWFIPEIATVLLLLVGGVPAGLAGLAAGKTRPGRWLKHCGVLFAVALLLTSGAGAALGWPHSICVALALPAALALLLAGLRNAPQAGLRVAQLAARNPRLHGAFLLLLGPVLAIGWSLSYDRAHAPVYFDRHFPSNDDKDIKDQLFGANAPHEIALTDSGREVRVYTAMLPATLTGDLAQQESGVASSHSLQLIRTGAGDGRYNCHGWVFAAGKGWVRSADVDRILEDNGYVPAGAPQPGDVIVYRSSSGQVVHSGLVRFADGDLLLVESKWGMLGRFLHKPAEQNYSDSWTVYHSARRGHVLQLEYSPIDSAGN